MLIVMDLSLKSCKVEAIGEIFFVYFAEVLISSRRYELQTVVSEEIIISICLVLGACDADHVAVPRA
jgi:hypothetical protein